MATIGDRIRDIREKRKLTQDDLAKMAKMSKGFLSDVENSKRNVGSDILLRISNSLGASVDYLLRGETKAEIEEKQVIIPQELSQAAEELKLTYSETLELLNAHKSIIARRSNRSVRDFKVEDWKKLHRAIKGVYG